MDNNEEIISLYKEIIKGKDDIIELSEREIKLYEKSIGLLQKIIEKQDDMIRIQSAQIALMSVLNTQREVLDKSQILKLIEWITNDEFYNIPDWKEFTKEWGEDLNWDELLNWYFKNKLK